MRSVIILDPELKLDEIAIPYSTFVTLYGGMILNRIIKDKGWTISKAHNYMKTRFGYDPYIYSIIEQILAEKPRYQIIQRNPTNGYGSIIRMRIRNVKKDPLDLTLSIPSAVCPG